MEAGDTFDIPEPEIGRLVEWLQKNPGVVPALIRRVNKVAKTQYKVVTVVGSNPQAFTGVESLSNIVVPLPIQFPVQLMSPTAFTGTTLTGVIASHQALQTLMGTLLQQLANVSINPGPPA